MENAVLAAASAYNEKYYFNPEFSGIPKGVRDEIRIMSTLFCKNCGGIFKIGFKPDGTIFFETEKSAEDGEYDETHAGKEIEKLKTEKSEFLYSLGLWYKTFKTKEGLEIINKLKNTDLPEEI